MIEYNNRSELSLKYLFSENDFRLGKLINHVGAGQPLIGAEYLNSEGILSR